MKPYPLGHPFHGLCFKGPDPKAAPPPDPPVTERQTEVVAAERQTKRDSRKRKGQMASLLAGETGGFQGEGNDSQPLRSLLGGGG